MRLQPTFAGALRYYYLVVGNPQRLFNVFIWGGVDIVLWGFVSKYLDGVAEGAMSFTAILLGTLVFWKLVDKMQNQFILVFLEDSWARNFLNIFASPIRVNEYVGGISIACIVTTMIAFVFGAIVALFAFGMPIPDFGVSLVLSALVLALFGMSLGILSSCIVLRYGPSAEWFAWPIPVMIQPFVGVFYPVSVLPGWMQGVAALLPPTYAFEALRTIFAGGQVTYMPLLVGFILASIILIISVQVFSITLRWAIGTGAISRYGSESF